MERNTRTNTRTESEDVFEPIPYPMCSENLVKPLQPAPIRYVRGTLEGWVPVSAESMIADLRTCHRCLIYILKDLHAGMWIYTAHATYRMA